MKTIRILKTKKALRLMIGFGISEPCAKELQGQVLKGDISVTKTIHAENGWAIPFGAYKIINT